MHFISNKFYALILLVDFAKVVTLIEKYSMFKLKGIIGYKWLMLKCFVNNSPTLSKRTVRRQCLKIKLYFNDYPVTYFRECCFYLNILMTTQKVRYKQTIKNNLKKFHLILTVYLDPCFYHLVIIFIK